MATYKSMIRKGAYYLTRAVNASTEEAREVNFCKADAFCEGMSMALDLDDCAIWEDMKRKAEETRLESVKQGDTRAQARWDRFWK